MVEKTVIRIEKIVQGGEGLGRLPDGKTVFVPYVLPGELVEINVTETRGSYIHASLARVLGPSPQRIIPPCPYFGICGGCHFQHMMQPVQAEMKLKILRDQLQRIGKINQPPILGLITGEKAWNYRNQLQFHPTKTGKLGFMDRSGRQPIEISTCLLAMQGIADTWPMVDLAPEPGLRRVVFREDSDGEVMLVLEGEDEDPPEMEIQLPISAAYLDGGGRSVNLAGEDRLRYTVAGRELWVSPESFFQVNLEIAERMVQELSVRLELTPNTEVLELYSGVGLFSQILAERAGNLVAIETSPSACFDFAENLDSFENVSLYEGAVEDVLPALVGSLPRPELVLLDPPRAGLHPRARQALLALKPVRIAYISCDPSTLARDLKEFIAAGYELDSVQAFDMFPQTYHVETISILKKAN